MSIAFESRDSLLKPLQTIAGIVEKRHTLPILSNVLIQKRADHLQLTATDLEIEIETKTSTGFDTSEASFTVSAKKLIDILRASPDKQGLKIDLDASKAVIKCGKSRFSLQTLPAEDFPRLNISQLETSIRLPQNVLKNLLGQVSYAMAQQDIRYYLNGLLMVLDGKEIKAVATDGHRLAYTSHELDSDQPRREAILPRKTVLELSKLLRDSEDDVLIEFGNNQVRFTVDGTIMTSKVIDGKFPDYQRVIPQNNEKLVELDRQQFLQALQRAAILANEKFRGVNLQLGDDQLKIVCMNSEQEEAEDIIDIEYKHAHLNIGFNIAYLLDVLNNTSTEIIHCSFGDNNSSALFTLPEHNSFKYIVMPMRI